MANIKLLQEAIQAFASGETKAADAKVRAFFIEQANEINKKLEEEMKDELNEDFNMDPELDLEQEVVYDDGKGIEGWQATDDPINEEEEEVETSEVEVGSEESDDVGSSEESKWEGVADAFAELEAMFAELEGEDVGSSEEEVEVGVEDSSEFDDVNFGDESFKESVAAGRMKKVTEPNETAALSKSPVAGQPEAFVKGVGPVEIKDGSAVIKTSADVGSMSGVKVEDNDSVMDNAKGMMKDVKEPKTTAASSRSPLPKRK